jgi:hypothetical protein
MTDQSKGDKQRDVISLSPSARARRAELDALESEVLIALEKALEATRQSESAPTLAPLQTEQQQADDWVGGRRESGVPPDDVRPLDQTHTESVVSTDAGTGLAHSPEWLRSPQPAQFARSDVKPPRGERLPDGAIRDRIAAQSAGFERMPPERWHDRRLENESANPGDRPLPHSYHDHAAGRDRPTGSGEQVANEDFVRVLRQRHREAAQNFSEQPRGARQLLAIIARLALASVVAAGAAISAFHYMSANPPTESAAKSTAGDRAALPRLSGLAQDRPSEMPPTQRLVLTALSGTANRPIALGINADTAPPGAFVLIKGLPPASWITAGSAAGEGVWRVPVRDLGRAAVVPPPDYVGVMSLAVDLTHADGTVSDSDVLRLEWIPPVVNAIEPTPVKVTNVGPANPAFSQPPQPAVTPQAGAPPSGQAASVDSDTVRSAFRRLDAEELANLLKRAERYLQEGDVAAARLLLRHAAEADNVQATIALAATYDPVILRQLGALGATADVAKARAWYRKASELGSTEAALRLQQLSQDTR